MRIAIMWGMAAVLALAANGAWATSKAPAKVKGAKSAPSCAAIAFRSLPGGGNDGEQSAGLYKSRHAKLELHATVQNGAAANYYMIANGSRLAALKAGLPAAAESCATAKKMPKPQAAAAACTGDGFKLLVAHAGSERYALLYGREGGAWKYCGAGSF